jgi:DNA-binding transcriptional MerR regulator
MDQNALSPAEAVQTDDPLFAPACDGREINIREAAQEYGLTQRALRFYESKGLLKPRRDGSVRYYGPIERQKLSLIVKAKALGFTLGEIRPMLGAPPSGETCALSMSRRQCYEQIKLLEQRKRAIEAALAELRRTYSSFYVRLLNEAAATDPRHAP